MSGTPYPMVQLVSSSEDAAVVRFDCNAEGRTWPEHDGFTIGAPSIIGDPGAVGVEFGYRTVTFNLVISDGEAGARRVQSELARELLRNDNWLRFQFSPASPSQWFRVYRSAPGELSFARVYLDNRPEDHTLWGVKVSLVCDAYSLGEKQTIGPIEISPDPEDDNGIAYVLPDIKGDFPTPLRIDMPATLPPPGFAVCPAGMLAVSQLPEWPGLEVVQDADIQVIIGGANALVGSTAFASASGGTLKARTVAADTVAPPAAYEWETGFRLLMSPTKAGRYRLFARLLKGDTDPFAPLSWTVRGGGFAQSEPGDVVTFTQAYWDMVDLGVYTIPWGHTPLDEDYTVVASAGIDQPQISIEVLRGNSNGGQLRIDFVVAVPVDLVGGHGQTTLFFKTPPQAVNAPISFDGERQLMQWYTVEGDLTDASYGYDPDAMPELSGAWPTVDPASVNVLQLVRRRGNGESHSINLPAELTLSYRPRLLYVAAE